MRIKPCQLKPQFYITWSSEDVEDVQSLGLCWHGDRLDVDTIRAICREIRLSRGQDPDTIDNYVAAVCSDRQLRIFEPKELRVVLDYFDRAGAVVTVEPMDVLDHEFMEAYACRQSA